MKKIILVLGIAIGLTAAQIVVAQTEGTILYEMKVNMHRNLPAERQAMKEMIPEFNVHKSQLLFGPSESLYVNIEEEEDDFEMSDRPVQVRMVRPMNEFYYNFETKSKVTLKEFFGKRFIIADTIAGIPWKLLDESKVVLDKNCKKAVWQTEENKRMVVAWYTMDLPSYLGPEDFNMLPGTVLQIDINDGERVITATSIELASLPKNALKAPFKGEKISEDDFQKMLEEHRRKVGASGNIIIRN